MTPEEMAKKHARLDVLDEVTATLGAAIPDTEEWRAHKVEVLGAIQWMKQQDGRDWMHNPSPSVVERERAAFARMVEANRANGWHCGFESSADAEVSAAKDADPWRHRSSAD